VKLTWIQRATAHSTSPGDEQRQGNTATYAEQRAPQVWMAVEGAKNLPSGTPSSWSGVTGNPSNPIPIRFLSSDMSLHSSSSGSIPLESTITRPSKAIHDLSKYYTKHSYQFLLSNLIVPSALIHVKVVNSRNSIVFKILLKCSSKTAMLSDDETNDSALRIISQNVKTQVTIHAFIHENSKMLSSTRTSIQSSFFGRWVSITFASLRFRLLCLSFCCFLYCI